VEKQAFFARAQFVARQLANSTALIGNESDPQVT
jgi:hypothetical protein